MRVLAGLTLFMLLLALASYASLNFEKIEHLAESPATISVTGEGEVLAVPDTGQFTFSVTAKSDTAEKAQEMSGQSINAILAYLTESGIDKKDVKTLSYNLYPQYRWEEKICPAGSFCGPGERVADGFEVNQSVQVKVRDTGTAPTIITGVGERGATNISSLNFVIDDTDVLRAEARAAAIADAKVKADILADDLGVDIVRFSGYYEDEGGQNQDVFMARTMAMEEKESADFVGPNLPLGENKTVARVTLVYEVE